MDWLNDFIPSLRCPDTHQSLRLATEAEVSGFDLPQEGSHEAHPAGLITEDGSRLYLIDKGIPVLLPGSSVERR